MTTSGLACTGHRRRAELFARRDRLNGIDYVEVNDDGTSLCVHFFGDVPQGLRVDNVRITGGRRIRDLRVTGLRVETSGEPDRDDCLHLTLDREGDFSCYRLCLVGPDAAESSFAPYPGFDPRYSCADVRFRIDCATGLDCADVEPCPEPPPEPLAIDYLAKDYASFRQLMLDRLATTLPDWHERHEADLGITLVELLAYAADHLSYYQDAVATEAYLDTARQRRSVRRHAKLVDYTLHEGLNARAWVTVWTDADTPAVAPADFCFVTALPSGAGDARVLGEDDLLALPASDYRTFEPVAAAGTVTFRAAHSEIPIYTWGDQECCLARGATRATLLDGTDGVRALHLERGDVLVLEEVKGPATGDRADADPAHRHVVRLTGVVPATDPLLRATVLEVGWDVADALPFCLELSARLPAPGCESVDGVSVARGNVVLVDHGRTVHEPLGEVEVGTIVGDCACEGSVVEVVELPKRFEPTLAGSPLTWSDHVDQGGAAADVRDPRRGVPAVELVVGEPARTWSPVPDLLSSGPDAPSFVVEVDDDGVAHLRFGDGDLGMRPPARAAVAATYRVGNGTDGNVGRDTIVSLVVRKQTWSGITVRPRNPLAATGGTDPEPVAEAKLFAPYAFRTILRRAITAEDYARVAEQRGGLRAAARLAWTGSWYEARVGIDPDPDVDTGLQMLDDVASYLRPYRRIGHDLEVVAATKVPLDIELAVCADPQHARGDVRRAVLAVLGNRRLRGGGLGLFHPDALTFGTDVYASRLVAAAQAVDGVTSVTVTRLQRWNEHPRGEIEAGVLPIGDMEVAQVGNDPNLPERGQLTLVMGGGR